MNISMIWVRVTGAKIILSLEALKKLSARYQRGKGKILTRDQDHFNIKPK